MPEELTTQVFVCRNCGALNYRTDLRPGPWASASWGGDCTTNAVLCDLSKVKIGGSADGRATSAVSVAGVKLSLPAPSPTPPKG